MSIITRARGQQVLRAANRQLITDVLRGQGDTSRAELARLTGLSATTVSSLVAEMAGEGAVSEAGGDDRAPGRTGRPGRLVRLAGERAFVIGLELTYDGIRAAIGDLAGRVLAEEHVGLDLTAPDSLTRAVALVEQMLRAPGVDRTRVVRLVVGVPGAVDSETGDVLSAHLPAWRPQEPLVVLGEALGIPVATENDADLGALAEVAYGAGRGYDHVLYLNASIGIGLGVILSGQLHRGFHGGAGEIGHVEVVEPGDLCACGNRGCLETVAALDPVLASLRAVHPDVRHGDDLAALVAAGDRAAVRAVTDAGNLIGKVVAGACTLLAPQAVIVGGTLAMGGPHLANAVRAAVERYTQPRFTGQAVVLDSLLGQRATTLGALAAAVETEMTP